MIRITAGLAGFLILSHAQLRPWQYGISRRFDRTVTVPPSRRYRLAPS
jgi:hypothetical protein